MVGAGWAEGREAEAGRRGFDPTQVPLGQLLVQPGYRVIS